MILLQVWIDVDRLQLLADIAIYRKLDHVLVDRQKFRAFYQRLTSDAFGASEFAFQRYRLRQGAPKKSGQIKEMGRRIRVRVKTAPVFAALPGESTGAVEESTAPNRSDRAAFPLKRTPIGLGETDQNGAKTLGRVLASELPIVIFA